MISPLLRTMPRCCRNHRGRLLAVYVLLSTHSGQIFAVDVPREPQWRHDSRDVFVEYLVNIGCEACVQFAEYQHIPDFSLSSQMFGCADVDVLLPSLHWIYEATKRRFDGALPGLLVDGGANVGRATARWIAAFGDVFGRRVAKNGTQAPCIICAGATATEGVGVDRAAVAPPTVAVVAIEPSEGNFALLQKHAAEGGWNEDGYLGLNAALGSRPGEAVLAFTKGFAIDETATLLYLLEDPRERQHVRVMTLSEVVGAARDAFPSLGVDSFGIFLLKLDIEGLEPWVLRSIAKSGTLVKFVTFEFANNVWQEPLADVVKDLFDIGYFCFVITAERLFPVSGPFWDPIYEVPMWSNLVCGLEVDPDLRALVQLHASAVGIWPMLPKTYLAGYVDGEERPRSLKEAQHACNDIGEKCAGVTCECANGRCGRGFLPASAPGRAGAAVPGPCTLRVGSGGARRSPSDEVSFLRDPEAGELFLMYRRAAIEAKMSHDEIQAV
mmetsp:Transcript_47016/g.130995  ORF Transcript_47016/g.130995 Transcript_47016/m.130995 type:complete len:497 (-) Transcript_47016:28-1518(-)